MSEVASIQSSEEIVSQPSTTSSSSTSEDEEEEEEAEGEGGNDSHSSEGSTSSEVCMPWSDVVSNDICSRNVCSVGSNYLLFLNVFEYFMC